MGPGFESLTAYRNGESWKAFSVFFLCTCGDDIIIVRVKWAHLQKLGAHLQSLEGCIRKSRFRSPLYSTTVLTSLKLLSFVLYVNMFPYTHLLAIFNLNRSLKLSSSLSIRSFHNWKEPKGSVTGKHCLRLILAALVDKSSSKLDF